MAARASGCRLRERRLEGNRIGVTASGAGLGNGGAGVLLIAPAAQGNVVGGTAPGAGNIIASNGGDGVAVAIDAIANSIRGNSIGGNAGLGIDLDDDGLTGNDPGDGDSGANERQNRPVLSSATTDGTTLRIAGALDSAPDTNFGVDVYVSATCDPSGSGEGEVYAGTASSVTDATGQAAVDVSFVVTAAAGSFVTATATDPAGNTSEFSPCQIVGNATPDLGDDIVFINDGGPVPLLHLLDLDAGATWPLLGTDRPTAPSWSPDGDLIAYGSQTGLYTVSPSSGAITTIIPPGTLPVGGSPQRATWSPDGSWIAFDAGDDLWVVEVASGVVTRLTDEPSSDTNPAWSGDGRLAWRSNRSGGRVWTAAFDAAGPALIGATGLANSAAVPSQQREMDWSPDSSTLVLAAAVNAASDDDVFLLPTDGTGNLVQLTDDAGDDSAPSWSPDGATVVFASDRGGDAELFTTPAAGAPGTEVELLSKVGRDSSPDWGRSSATDPGPQGLLTVDKDGSGNGFVGADVGPIDCGRVCAASYAAGTEVTLSATAAPGSVFVGWSGGGCAGTDPCTVTAGPASTVTATFEDIAGQSADIEVTKTGPVSARVGDELTYDILVTNSGDDVATNTQVIDIVPDGLELVSVDPPDPTCTGTRRIVCNLGTLQVGEVEEVTVVARALQTGEIENEADVVADQPDPDPDNNTSSWGTRIDPPPPGLTVTKSGRVETGPRIEFTIDVENVGETVATGVVAKDTFEPEWELVEVSTTQGTCSGRLICAIGTLQPGQTATVVFTITFSEALGPIDNDVAVTCEECGSEVFGGTRVDPFPHPTVEKRHDGDFVAGEPGLYELTVNNTGTGPTTEPVTVVDTLPEGMTFVSSQGGGFTCDADGQIVECVRTDVVDVRAPITFFLTVLVDEDAPETVVNSVTIGGGGGPSQEEPWEDRGRVVPPEGEPVISVSKTVEQQTIRVGADLTYLIDVTNTGGGHASNVQVIDELPATVQLVSVHPSDRCAGTRIITCDIGDLAPDATERVTIVVEPREVTVLTNEAFASGDGLDTTGDSVTVEVEPGTQVGIDKVVSEPVVLRDATLSYTLTATNLGPGDATDLRIIDPLPRGVELLSITPSPGMTCNVEAPPPIDSLAEPVVCTISELADGKTTDVILVVRVLEVGQLENTACLEGRGLDLSAGGCDTTVTPVVDAPVTGTKFDDRDANGQRDEGEPGLEGWEIRAYVDGDGDGRLTAGENEEAGTATTGGQGDYSLLLPPGDYVLCEVAQPGWTQTAPAPDDGACGTELADLAPGGWAVTVTSTSVVAGRDFGNNEDAVSGTIEIEKQTLPDGDPTTFTFSGAVSGEIGDGGILTADVEPGTHVVTEALPADLWRVASIACDDDDSVGDAGAAQATIQVDAGETVRCTFTNEAAAVATITKVTDPMSSEVFDFETSLDGAPNDAVIRLVAGDTSTFTLRAGVRWSITELESSGWTLVDVDCGDHPNASVDGATVEFRPEPGDLLECTYVNGARADVSIWKEQRIEGVDDDFTAEPVDAEPGDLLTYRLTVRNSGVLDADGVTVIDTFDPRLRLRADPPLPANCRLTPELRCDLGTLPAGAEETIVVPMQLVHPDCDVMGTRFDDDGIERSALIGTGGDDVMCGAGGGDRLLARSGDDVVYGYLPTSPAMDLSDVVNVATVTATTAESSSVDNSSNEVVATVRHSVDTVDTVLAGSGDDRVFGQAAGDILNGESGRDEVRGGPGDDSVRGGSGNDRLFGDDGDDTLRGETGADTLAGGDGDDALRGDASADTLIGGEGDDDLRGGTGNDRLFGDDGDDALLGEGGVDTLQGGDGADIADGGSMNDTVFGGNGSDVVRGGTGNDTLWGDLGGSIRTTVGAADHLDGGPGNDRLYGQGGGDWRGVTMRNGSAGGLYGGPGNDILWGGSGEDGLFGQDGADFLDGGAGDDTLRGGAGNDRAFGQSGNDIVGGGPGNDQLFGGTDSDLVEGNEGATHWRATSAPTRMEAAPRISSSAVRGTTCCSARAATTDGVLFHRASRRGVRPCCSVQVPGPATGTWPGWTAGWAVTTCTAGPATTGWAAARAASATAGASAPTSTTACTGARVSTCAPSVRSRVPVQREPTGAIAATERVTLRRTRCPRSPPNRSGSGIGGSCRATLGA